MKTKSPGISLPVLFLGLFLGDAADTQVITGTLVGSVRDESGAVLPGALVSVTSPSLQGGSVSATTNDAGRFRLVALPPGVYSLDAKLDGFQSYREEQIRVEIGRTVERNITLPLEGFTEEVTVTASGSLVDGRRVGVHTVYTSEFVEMLPRLRNDLVDLVKTAPGMSPTNPTSLSAVESAMSAFGSAANDNVFLIDGSDHTDPWLGTNAPLLNADSIDTVEIISSGASAEYGNVQGAVFNVVTRRGGNDWRLHASYFHQNENLASQQIKESCNCPAGETAFKSRRHDFSADVGGMLIDDRLWFFGGYQRRSWKRSGPGADPRFAGRGFENRFIEKINWQISPRIKLLQAYQDGSLELPDLTTPDIPPEVGTTRKLRRPSFTFVSVTYLASESTLFDFRLSRSGRKEVGVPVSGRSLPFHYDLATGKASGGSWSFNNHRSTRLPVIGKVTHYAEDFIKGQHEFKFGVQFTHTRSGGIGGYPGGVSYRDYAGEPYFAYFQAPSSDMARVRNFGVFAEDVIQIGPRLTFQLGARFDRNSTVSNDAPAVDAEGYETGDVIHGLGPLFQWNFVSPRLGFAVKLTGDGRTLLHGHWGRYAQGNFAGIFTRFHPGITPFIVARFDPGTGEYSDIIAVYTSPTGQRVDPNMRAPYSRQLSIGVDREIGNRSVIRVTYMRKEGRNSTGWVDIGGVYGTDVATLPDGREITVFPLLNSPSERLFWLTNPSDWYLRYNGLLLTFERRWSGRWQAFLSYGLSETTGLDASSIVRPGGDQFSGGIGGSNADPNKYINAEGNLPSDRSHMLRIQATGEIPKIALLVGASFQYLSGTPWAATAVVRLPQGGSSIFIEPRGARRLPSYTLLDFRISKVLQFGRRARMELVADILNVLNSTTTQRVVSTNFFSPNFEKGTAHIPPRRAIFGVKVAF